MNTSATLRVLIVEDTAADAELIAHQLEDAGYRLQWTRVETEADYLAALDAAPDLILSDYSLPRFNGMRALALLKERGLDIPFILVSGTVGEDLAVAALVAGAGDYVLKDTLARLAPAVQRELQACALRRERRETRISLERQSRVLAERVKELTCLYSISALAQQPGLPLEELLEQSAGLLVKAYQWPEQACARIVHGDITRQTTGFRLTAWRQDAPLTVDGVTEGSITVCYLDDPSAVENGPFLAEERQMLDAVARRIGDSISDRRLRAALAERERNFHETFNQAAVGIVHTSLDRRYLEVNQKFCEMTGYTRDELLGMETAFIAHPDDRVDDVAHRKLLLARQIETYAGEKRYVRKDGTVFWAQRTVSLARDSAGQPMYFIRVIEDITERKQLAARMQQTFEQAAVGIVRADLRRNIIDANRKFCEMTGYSREELLQMTVMQISHPEDRRRDVKLRSRLLAGEIDHFRTEKRYVRKDGSSIWVRRTTSLARDAINHDPHYIIVVEDVTDRKSAEERYRATFDRAPVGIMHSSLDSRILHVNPRLCKILGYTREELLTLTLADIIPPDDRGIELAKFLEPMLVGKIETFSSERPLVRKDGAIVWVNRHISLVRDTAGQPLYFLRTIEDISEKKSMEDQLARERQLLRTVIDAMPERVFVKDREGRFLLQNAANLKVRGFERHDDILGKTVFDIYPRELAEQRDAEDRAIMESGLPLINREGQTYFGDADKRQQTRWHLTSKIPLKDAKGRIYGIVGINHDITDQKLAAIALQESERFAKSTIDALTKHLCVLDETGTIIAVNKAWRDFAEANGGLASHQFAQGANYLAVCDAASGDNAAEGAEFAAGIRGVLRGELKIFTLEYACHSPHQQRWFVGRVKPFQGQGPRRVVVSHEDITQRKLAEQQLRRLNQLYSTLSQTNAAIVRIKNRDTLFNRICQIAVEQNQFALSWIGLVDSATGLIRPVASAGSASSYLDGLRLSIDAGLREGHGTSSVAVREERTVVCNDIVNTPALELWHDQARAAGLRAVASLPLKTSGKVIGVLTFMAGETGFFDDPRIALLDEMAEDISYALDGMELESRHRRTQAALLDSDEKFRELARNIPQLFWMTDAEQKSTIYASPAYETISGRPVAELETEPQAWLKAIHEDDRERVQRARKERAPLGTYDIEYRVVHTDGGVRWMHDRAFPVRNPEGHFYRIAGIAEDITERKLAEEQLANLAHYDSLTGLPNRVLFNDRLHQAMAQARRNDWILGVLFLDLDRFKLVNDTLGHAKGDLLLKQVAARLVGNLRPTDTVGRLSGDEFAVILTEINTTQSAGYVAQKIIDALAAPFELDGSEVFVTASIGIALYPSDSENIDALLRDADAAMYGAKAAGRNNYQYYTAAMNEKAREKLTLETSLRRALERGEFRLYYQPKISIASGNISGLEALLRWQSPVHGLVSPGQFIPLLEETGLIVPVGEWVTRAACAQLQAWQRAGLAPVPVAINLSARQLRQQGYARMLERTLREFDIDPELIHVEITESSLMENPEEAIIALKALKALGIRLEADDFGTGYSSLSYLKRFPLDALKIDRSFVRDITTDEEDAVIAQAVITLAHSLGLSVIAEGVETREQLTFLADRHCDEAQGYLIARPMPADDCSTLLAGHRPLHYLRPDEPAQPPLPTVLIVDDDSADLELTSRLLQKDGHSVITATSTEDAFAMLDANRISIVIADHNMPGMSGVEFLRQVRLAHPEVMRIMLSGIDDFGTATSAINESGVHKFFVKGRDSERLRREVKRKNRHAPARRNGMRDMTQPYRDRPRRLTMD